MRFPVARFFVACLVIVPLVVSAQDLGGGFFDDYGGSGGETGSVICPYCGQENPAGQEFCSYCRRRLPMTTGPEAAIGDARTGLTGPLKQVIILMGERLYCANCGQLLKDADTYIIFLPQESVDLLPSVGYHDDGLNGDLEAKDDIYAYKIIEENRSMLGEACYKNKKRLQILADRAVGMDPFTFFGINVPACDDSTLRQRLKREQDRLQRTVLSFRTKALARYKDPNGEYYPIFTEEPSPLPAGQPQEQSTELPGIADILPKAPLTTETTTGGFGEDYDEMPAPPIMYGS